MFPIFKELCQIFCCPPFPSHIAAKLAFVPPQPTYSIVSSASPTQLSINFHETANWVGSHIIKSHLDVTYTITSRQSRIVCMYISIEAIRNYLPQYLKTSTREKPKWTVFFSHGNAVDVGQMAWFLVAFAAEFNVNVFCYDYSGYGLSSGQTLEQNLYADAEAALDRLHTKYGVNYGEIVLYGQSIGTAPTVHLGTKYKVAGVVLHSPLMSGIRVLCPNVKYSLCFDPFPNIDKAAKILSLTLIIHGDNDEVIGIHHGQELHSRLRYPLDPAWVKGAGHNDIENSPDYSTRLHKFFNEDLRSQPSNGLEAHPSMKAKAESLGSVNEAFKIEDNNNTPAAPGPAKNATQVEIN